MKPSPRIATIIIFLLFLFFNGLQVSLILERINEATTKFETVTSSTMLFTLSEYHKLKAIDSASMPAHAWITYSRGKIELNKPDSQSVIFNTEHALLVTDTVAREFIVTTVNIPVFRSVDLVLMDSIFHKALDSKKIRSAYRLDTITVSGRRLERQMLQAKWVQKQRKNEYPYTTHPLRLPYNSNIFIFAQVAKDPNFFLEDLLWPMMAFGFILLVSNAALVVIYRTIRKQKRTNELKTDFINNITHEMKTPITIASAGLDALEHHVNPNERTRFYLHTSKRQLNLLNDFVERILEAVVQDVSDLTLKNERIDLHGLFEELVQSHSVLEGKPVSFTISGKGPVYIHGDRLHLETAFHNVIDNAIKYSNESVIINIDIVKNNRDCTIRISDNGMGIPPQFTKNIFEKFFRVPQGDAQPVKGFGLGLYYVSSIIRKHGGHITVNSKLQSGTELIITLPIHS